MTPLSEPKCREWCVKHEIPLDERKGPSPFGKDATEFAVPSDSGRRISLVRRHLESFRSASIVLVWITEWGVWPSSERMHIFERFRLSYGVSEPLIELPGHLLTSSEYEDTVSFVTLATLYFWDCYVLTPRNKKAVFYSHDEFGLLRD